MRRKLLASFVVAAMCISMIACGGSSSGGQEGESEAPDESVSEETQSPEEDSEKEEESSTEPEEAQEKTEVSVPENQDDNYLGGVGEDGGYLIESCQINGVDEIIVPDTLAGLPVTGISEYAFTSLDCKKIKLPDTVTYIGPTAFALCDNLEEVDLGKGLKYITTSAFMNCRNLKSVTFPDGMETIDDILINTCPEVGEIYIPASVTTMPDVLLFSRNLCPKAVIVTPEGSAAEEYAKEFDLPYINR